MKYINRIKIQYFRSIYKLDIKEISPSMTVFTGKNDTGKSNVLRALNLFFNNEVDPNDKLNFDRDFSKIRNKQITESSKERKLISIEIEFNNPGTYSTLEKTFTYRKSWDRYGKLVENEWKKGVSDKGKGAANKFLNSIEYIYIPAIKDKNTFFDLLQRLKSSLPKPKSLEIEKFNNEIKTYGQELKEDLYKNINLKPSLSLPTSLNELFSSLDFIIDDEVVQTSLSQRGDGVRCRFIPAIINYIAKNDKSKRYIWGLEEPENSLEFAKALELNTTLEKLYSKHAQIFVTSHSPAFVGEIKEDSLKCIHLLVKNNERLIKDNVITRNLLTRLMLNPVGEELGYIKIQKELSDKLNENIKAVENQKQELNKLKETVENTTNKYILLVEGINDKKAIEVAWSKINNSDLPFFIHICYSSNQIRTLLARDELCKLHPDKVFIGMFDFDNAFSDWDGLRDKTWAVKEQDEKIGLLKKNKTCNKYAFLLPIPDFRNNIASKSWGNNSLLELELLFNDNIVLNIGKATKKKITGGTEVWNITDNVKNNIFDSLKKIKKEDFEEFKKIFNIINKIQQGEYQ